MTPVLPTTLILEPTTTPTTQQSTTTQTTTTEEPTTETPTTAEPTTEETPTTEAETPTTEATTEPTTEEPTTETPSTPAPRPPVAICNTARNSAGDLLVICTSDTDIQSITLEVNSNVIGTFDGDRVTVTDDIVNEGQNVIELTVNYANDQSYIVVITYEVDRRPTTAPPAAYVECTTRFSSVTGMEVTCIVNNDTTGSGITSICYNVNNQGELEADSIPTFTIGVDQFQNGENRVVITIKHSAYRPATIPIDLNVQIAPTTPPPPPCQVSCNYHGTAGALQFVCEVVEGDGNLLSVGYTVNGNSGSDLATTFQIPVGHLVDGTNEISLTFSVVCNGQQQTIRHRLSLSISLPTPPTCRPSNVRATSASAISGVQIRYTLGAESVSFSIILPGEDVLLYSYSLNRRPTEFAVSLSLQLQCSWLSQGQNTLQLTVFGSGGSQTDLTLTFDA
jgi:hypothetical protein